MYRYMAILASPLLKLVHRNARVRNVAEKMLRPFPGLKMYLQARLLYAHAARLPHSRTPLLRMGDRQQRIYEELERRLGANGK